MIRQCERQDCYQHEGESCAFGKMKITECPYYHEAAPQVGEDIDETEEDSARVPWSGSALGLSDLTTLASRTKTIIVGTLGAHDAGKTTFLLANYLLCLRSGGVAGSRFSGSWTLGAWEALASWVRLHDATQQPQFPPHTPRSLDRVPGLLHLALRGEDDSVRDVLFTDAPGEWFSNWTIRRDSPESAGARWVADQSDVYLVIADCGKLSGAQRGRARSDLRQLIERLGSYVNGRPVLLVWAKTDVCNVEDLAPGIKESIRKALQANVSVSLEVQTTVSSPESFSKALERALGMAWDSNLAEKVLEPVLSQRPFYAFRGHDNGIT